MHRDTEQTHRSSQSKPRGICKLAGKPKNHKDGTKVCLAKYNSKEEAGQEAENRENKCLSFFFVDTTALFADQDLHSMYGRSL